MRPEATEPQRKHVLEMLGEATRDAGILIGVFGYLDGYARATTDADRLSWLLYVTFWTVVLLGSGIAVERSRPVE